MITITIIRKNAVDKVVHIDRDEINPCSARSIATADAIIVEVTTLDSHIDLRNQIDGIPRHNSCKWGTTTYVGDIAKFIAINYNKDVVDV